jgi:hypothetical protein
MSTHYNVTFFNLLPGSCDETGFIDEPVVTVEAEGSQTFRYTTEHDFLGNALPMATGNGKPVIAHVVVVSEHEGNEISRLVRRFLIGDPGNAVAVRFTSTTTGLISKACALHDLNDALALYDLGRNAPL